MLNHEFIETLRGGTECMVWTAVFTGDPATGAWRGGPYSLGDAKLRGRADGYNTYYCVAGLMETSESRANAQFERLLCLVGDDIDLSGLRGGVSYVLRTSLGTHQAGVFLDPEDPDCADLPLVGRVMGALRALGFVDGSGNSATRYVRLPCGVNGKPRESGEFATVLKQWRPQVRIRPADAAAVFCLDLDALRAGAQSSPAERGAGEEYFGEGLAAHLAAIRESSSLHGPITSAAASLAYQAYPREEVVALLRGVMEEPAAPRDERWKDRYDQEIRHAVDTAVAKFGPGGPQARESGPGGSPTLAAAREALSGPVAPLHDLPADDEKHPHIVEYLLPREEVTLLSGHGGSGKRMLSLVLAAHVALGREFAGPRLEQAPVVFFSADDGGKVIRRRVAKRCKAYGFDPDELAKSLHILDVSALDAALFREAGGSWREPARATQLLPALGERVQELGPSLVIVDHASETFDDDEVKRSSVRGFLHALRGGGGPGGGGGSPSARARQQGGLARGGARTGGGLQR